MIPLTIMPLNSHFDKETNTFFIEVSKKFNSDCNDEFREAIKGISSSMGTIIVDLHNADYADSAALGMLLILRNLTLSNSQYLQIDGAKGEVKKTLDIANFGQLITMT